MAAYQDSEGMPKVARTAKVQVVPRGQEDTHEMPAHLKVLADRGMYDRARRALRVWAVLIVRYLSGKRGAKQATIREIGRVVFEGSANRDYRALVQALLLDYLGLAKAGRETRTLVEIFPEFFLVQGENAQGEGAIVTLRDDAPDIGDDEAGDMAKVRQAVDEYEREQGPGNQDVVPEVAAAAAGLPAASDPAAAAARAAAAPIDDSLFRTAVRRAFPGMRFDGAPSRRRRRGAG